MSKAKSEFGVSMLEAALALYQLDATIGQDHSSGHQFKPKRLLQSGIRIEQNHGGQNHGGAAIILPPHHFASPRSLWRHVQQRERFE
jgi:hypothetical protein